jgi:selenide,water dikinase
MTANDVRLTQYSHGAGCGCKIAPDVLSRILAGADNESLATVFPSLLVGHETRDDAAAVVLDGDRVILSTTDFFMPIVDDPYDFGRIAATNAISDIYAMGGTPLVAVAILGWPVAALSPEIANLVVKGGRDVCRQLGFPLAGGHSIDAPEPLFGLAVTGAVKRAHLKRNGNAKIGDQLLLTKPLGVGILTTAEKQGKLHRDHLGLATDVMCRANDIGAELAKIEGVHALTDVTGFGLAGHLLEMCDGANLMATLDTAALPELPALDSYIEMGCVPGGTQRNFDASYERLPSLTSRQQAVLCDPQTSGVLLVAVSPDACESVQHLLLAQHLATNVVGVLQSTDQRGPRIALAAS